MSHKSYAERQADRAAYRAQQEQDQKDRPALEALNRTTNFNDDERDELYSQAWKNSNADVYLSVEDAYRDLAEIAHFRR